MKKAFLLALCVIAAFSACKKSDNNNNNGNNNSGGTPVASFTIKHIKAGVNDADTFISTSTNAASVYWNFGDNYGTDSVATSVYSYVNPGTYTVTLTAYNSNKSKSSKVTQTVTVDTAYNYPEAIIYITCLGVAGTNKYALDSPVYFSSSQSTYATSYFWNFGDGTSSTLANPTHIYKSSGSQQNGGWNVYLTVYHNSKALANTAQQLVYIYQ